jgi:purine catabolism regulator
VNRRTFVPLVVRGGDPARLDRMLRLLGLPGLVAELSDGATALLLSLPRDQDAEALAEHFAVRLRHETGVPAVVAAAGPRTAWDDVPFGLREALHVAEAAAGTPADQDRPALVRLRDVHLRGLVRLLRDDPHVQSFAERELDGLLCGPRADPRLLPVLRTYLATGRNKSRTAQLHHVSRPALYRRLEVIQERLGIDLDDFEQAASVHIALLAHDAQQR